MPVIKSCFCYLILFFCFSSVSAQDCVIDDVRVQDLRHNQGRIVWSFDQGADFSVTIEYGTTGFTPGDGQTVMTSDSSILVDGLMQNTTYDYYISYTCASGSSAPDLGPFEFTTRFALDGAVTEVLSLASGCNLEADKVEFLLRNEGGRPLSLVEINYRVNDRGEDPSYPIDGLYTGLLGTDSSDIYAFDNAEDYPEPGDYEYEIWINWEKDQNRFNDTARFLVTNAPIITNFPYTWGFESWSGGWYADEQNLYEAFWQRRGSEPRTPAYDSTFVWGPQPNYRINQQVVANLLSPCFDFSEMENDPVISAALYSDNFASSDHVLILEYSKDQGITWNRILNTEAALNWNTGTNNEVWSRPINAGEWSIVENIVPGLAGEQQVQFRWQYFRRDSAALDEGWLIDRIEIRESRQTDLALSPLPPDLGLNCTMPLTLDLRVRNLGNTEVNNFNLELDFDGQVVFSESYNFPLSPQEDTVITVDFGPSSSFTGNILATAELLASGDEEVANNTTTQNIVFYPIQEVPVFQDFTDNRAPNGWLLNGGEVFPINSFIGDVIINTVEPGENWNLITTSYGPLTSNNSLIFALNWADTTGSLLDLGPADSICIYLSTDCLSESRDLLQTYHAGNYNPLTEFPADTLDLSDYEGETVIIGFEFKNNSAQRIRAELDNFIIRGCPREVEVMAEITAVKDTAKTGKIELFVDSSINSWSFEWSHNDQENGNVVASLSAGEYMVTITDTLLGCSTIRTYTVDSCAEDLAIEFNSSRDNQGNFYSGFIEITNIEGELSDYEIEWSNGLANVPGIYNLPNDKYALLITNAQGCEYRYNFDLLTTNQAEVSNHTEGDANALILYPNPSTGTVYLRTSLKRDEILAIQVLDPLTGMVIRHRSLESLSVRGEDYRIDGLKNGMNIVSIQTKQQVYSFKVVVQRN